MSMVYFAREARTGRPAAVKIVQAGLPANMAAEPGRPVLDALGNFKPAPNSVSLRTVLTMSNLQLLGAHLATRDNTEVLVERRRSLHARYTDLARRLGRSQLDRAELEAALVLERAQVSADQERLNAQRMGLKVELDALERALARALARGAMDLAVSFGL
jgi:hypothetical protein